MINRFYSSSSCGPLRGAVASVVAGSARLSPAARHMVESQSLNVNSIIATAKGGKIISKGDVIAAISSGAAKALSTSTPQQSIIIAAAAPTPVVVAPSPQIGFNSDFTKNAVVNDRYKDIPLSKMRTIIAKRLTESKATVPHMYSSIEIEIDSLLNLRKQLKKEFEINVSVNDIVIKCAALALRDMPEVNGKWDKKTNSRVIGGPVDISVAVATPTGLITPIVFNADKLSSVQIGNTVRELAGRAKEGKLKPEEYQGGSFSISNLGMFGITAFSAVINPPQACIMAVGSGVSRPKVKVGKDGEDKLGFVDVMTVQLSGDRRVVDEATASQFLQVFQSYMSSPTSMML